MSNKKPARELYIRNMGAVRFGKVEGMKVGVVVATAMGQTFRTSLQEVLEKKLTPLQFDQPGCKRMNIHGLSGIETKLEIKNATNGTALSWMGIQSNIDLSSPLALFHPGEDVEDVRKLILEEACASVGDKVSAISGQFNDLRTVFYEYLPSCRGKLRGYDDLRDIDENDKRAVIRKHFSRMLPKDLCQHAGITNDFLTPASIGFINGDVKPEDEFGAITPVTVYSTNGKAIGTGYVGMSKDSDMAMFDIEDAKEKDLATARVYYPNDKTDYFILVLDYMSKENHETFVLTDAVDVINTINSKVKGASILAYNPSKDPITKELTVTPCMKLMGHISNLVWDPNWTLEELKEIARHYFVKGYSDKNKDEIVELLCEKLSDLKSIDHPLKGNYVAIEPATRQRYGYNSRSNTKDNMDIIARVSGSVFLADKEIAIAEAMMAKSVVLYDVLNPFEEGLTWTGNGTGDLEKAKAIASPMPAEGEDE